MTRRTRPRLSQVPPSVWPPAPPTTAASKPDRTFSPSPATPSPPMLEVIGPVRVRLYVQASVPYIDLHARLCDVTPRGRSINISDGIVRLTDAAPRHRPSRRV